MGNPFKHRWLKTTDLLHALRLRCKARKDEKNGMLLTAAMEWRHAASLCAPIRVLADRCWREWERIMRLPRRMAAPIGEAPIPRLEVVDTSSVRIQEVVVAGSAPLQIAA